MYVGIATITTYGTQLKKSFFPLGVRQTNGDRFETQKLMLLFYPFFFFDALTLTLTFLSIFRCSCCCGKTKILKSCFFLPFFPFFLSCQLILLLCRDLKSQHFVISGANFLDTRSSHRNLQPGVPFREIFPDKAGDRAKQDRVAPDSFAPEGCFTSPEDDSNDASTIGSVLGKVQNSLRFSLH